MNAAQRLVEANAVARLRDRDPSLFTDKVDARQTVQQRLGWTDLAEKAEGRLPLLRGLAQAMSAEGCEDIVLLGMGGSSLAPLVLSRVIGSAEGFPRLHVLDTTSPLQIRHFLGVLDPEKTFFVVASKSGTTIEPLSLYAIFHAWMEQAIGRVRASKRFLVITDQGTPLDALRQKDMLRTTLSAPHTVGGRYSALTMFGLAPAVFVGVDVDTYLSRARAMEKACHGDGATSPGAALAAWIADAFEAGRDKLTVACSPQLASFALWVEQLVAESTGKDGKGVVPIPEDSPLDSGGYGSDRAVFVLRFETDRELAAWAERTRETHPVHEIAISSAVEIGAEFVRWKHAVALLGHLMGVNPFDEPNVTEAKAATTALLERGGEVPRAYADVHGAWITAVGALSPPSNQHAPTLAGALRQLIETLRAGDYFALLAYLPEDEGRLGPLREALRRVSRDRGIASCLELGPRYLHSTGQLHKGGPDSGAFLLVTTRDRADLEIPRKPYTLATLHRAQAEGDLITLARYGRRVLRVDLPNAEPDSLRMLGMALGDAAEG